MKALFNRISNYAARNKVFVGALLVFICFTTLFALTAPINVTDDENYHFNAIRLHGQQAWPIINTQTEFEATGSITRNPSYFYHYLLGIPYSLLNWFSVNDSQALVWLRLINLSFGITSALMLRRFLRRVSLSKNVADYTTAAFLLLPITIITFGGLNYDNLAFAILFVSLNILLSLFDKPSLVKLLGLLLCVALGSITKFEYIPLYFGVVVGTMILVVRQKNVKTIFKVNASDRFASIFLCILLLLAGSLVAERQMGNLTRYGNLTPACEVVHTYEDCIKYPPGLIHYQAKLNPAPKPWLSPHQYLLLWLKTMLRTTAESAHFATRIAIVLYVGIGLACFILLRSHGYKSMGLAYALLGSSASYILLLFFKTYASYSSHGHAFAINGRYLLPVLPFLFLTLHHSIITASKKWGPVVVLIFICALLISNVYATAMVASL